MTDEYEDDTFEWWHLSTPSPELLRSIEDGWLPPGGRVLDVGCGLGTEAAHLASLGLTAIGVDLSVGALRRAAVAHPAVRFVRADALRLPLRAGVFDVALDRGCLHYLREADRTSYLLELERVLRPGGRLLLRACLRSAGQSNDLTIAGLTSLLAWWRICDMQEEDIPSDTRMMQAVVVRVERSS